MLGIVALLMLVNVIKAPLFSIWLWPLIPAAVVGFWPEKPKAVAKTETQQSEPQAKKKSA
jgi:hypothetical protein